MFKFIFIVMVFAPLLSSAHARLVESSPAKESVVVVAPQIITIKFSEILEASMSKIEVKNLSTGEIVSGKTEAGNEKTILLAHLEILIPKKTKFEVSWKAVAKDSHTMKGNYSFTYNPGLKK